MCKTIVFLVCTVTLLSARFVSADIVVNFIESAPKDRFVVKNTGRCALKDFTLKIDLSQSDGRLIFDTTATGAGVDVFQPFEVGEGAIELVSSEIVSDGDVDLSVSIGSLAPEKSVSFTIDVDDTLPQSELGKTRVAGREIKNASVEFIRGEQKPVTAVFGADSKAIVSLASCPLPKRSRDPGRRHR